MRAVVLLLGCIGCVPTVRAGAYYATPLYEPARATSSTPAAYRVFPAPPGCTEVMPPILFLPALGFTGESWSRVAARLLACRARILVDIPGIGESREADRVPRPEVVAAIEDVVRAESGGRPVVLAGNSIGGMLATWVALGKRVPVAALVLVDAPLSPFVLSRSERAALHPIALGPLIRLAGPYLAERIALPRSALGGHPADPLTIALTVEQTLDSRRRRPMQRYHESIIEERALAEELAGLPRLTLPTLLVWGDRDRVASPSLAAITARALGGRVEQELLRDVGHLAPLEVPDELAQRIDAFLATLPAEAAAPVDATARRPIAGVHPAGSILYSAAREWFPVLGGAALFTLDGRTDLDVVAGIARGSIDRHYPLETGRLVWTVGAGFYASPARPDWAFGYLRTTLRLELVWKWIGGVHLDGTLLADPSPGRIDRVGGFGAVGYSPSVVPWLRGFVGYGSFPATPAQVLFGIELDARLTGWLF